MTPYEKMLKLLLEGGIAEDEAKRLASVYTEASNG